MEENEKNESKKKEGTEEKTPNTPNEKPSVDPEQPSSGQNPYMRKTPELEKLEDKVNKVRDEIGKMIIGQHDMVDLLLVGLFSNGHVLLEGVPGVAKTLTAKVLSKIMGVEFSRIQFTPDMMPTDILGTSVFNMKESNFNFKKGPIFSNIILIDEINRAPAKTQAALFEVMEERQITFDGKQYDMDFPFLVMATQNPVEQEGTYNLPEAQLDRFLFKINLDYPSQEEETEILKRFKKQIKSPDLSKINTLFSSSEIQQIQDLVENIDIQDSLLNYISSITVATRNHGSLFLGGSPRASLSILKSAKAMAAINGRNFVVPDDIQEVAFPVLNHRLILTPEAEMEGIKMNDLITDIVKSVEVPR